MAVIIVGEQYILEAEKAAIEECIPVAIGFYRNSLSRSETCIVLKSDVTCGKVVCLDEKT
jgi:hypothetical protein